MRLARAVNVEDVRRIASRRLPRPVFEVIEGGAGDETTLAANRRDLEALRLRPRSLVDVSGVDLATEVVGQKLSMPMMLAPVSFTRMCDPQAERAIARAAGAQDVGYIVPGGASETIEAIAEVARAPLWYQIYMHPDSGVNQEKLDRARDAGAGALVVSVDTPMKPHREKDIRNGITLPLRLTPKLIGSGALRPRWAKNFLLGNRSWGFSPTGAFAAYLTFDRAMQGLRPVTLDEVQWLRDRWDGPLVVKGILSDDRIRDLVGIGVEGVSVSNHGGRNLDGVVSAVSALPRVLDAAAGDLDVLVDGGFRRGVDILRALALGAKAVLIGRPYMYGLAAGGSRGVERVIEMLRNELLFAMAFTGATSVSDITPDMLAGISDTRRLASR